MRVWRLLINPGDSIIDSLYKLYIVPLGKAWVRRLVIHEGISLIKKKMFVVSRLTGRRMKYSCRGSRTRISSYGSLCDPRLGCRESWV